MDADRQKQLQAFVDYAKTLDGDEKGEAQVFLDRLFRAFSRNGYKEAGAKLEERVTNDRGGTSFADLIWKPVVLIEMKKRGEDLSRHLTQAFDYWVRSVPNRPQYVVLCNFDEFRIYDFDQDINQPQDTLTLDELPQRSGPLDFLWPTNERARFRIDREDATRKAAAKLSAIYQSLKPKHPGGTDGAQRFVLQALVCFFSEDIGLLPRAFFTDLLEECTAPPKAFDLLDGLFRAMNQRGGVAGGRYKGVEYFNGGIFAQSAAVELDPHAEVAMLKEAATYNWSHVSPDIFGTIFQHSMDADERHAMGAHYTAQADIMRIVKPTIVDPFTLGLAKANTLKELAALKTRLQSVRVLDPACGSGNFLYIAYREMRRLEAAISAKENQLSSRQAAGQIVMGGVSPRQFFGMDVLPFAVELAKVTLSLAPKLASDELHSSERTLPLANLDNNIKVQDALLDDQGKQTLWPAADIIIGNPPFLGAKRLKPERGADYVNALRKAYPDVPGMADYCVYWFRRAHDHLQPCTAANWHAGRAGLVGTQNIRNNQSRVGGLDHIVASGTIVEAVENMPWSGEANVHVSIANWVKNVKVSKTPAKPGEDKPTPMPGPGPSLKDRAAAKAAKAKAGTPPPGGGGFAKAAETTGAAEEDGGSPADDDDIARNMAPARRLWTKVEATAELVEDEKEPKRPKTITLGKRGKIRKDKSYEMAARESAGINSALSDEVDLSGAVRLKCNTTPQRVFQGQAPGHNGFYLTFAEAKKMIAADPRNKSVLYPFLNGRELVTGDGKPTRIIIDFQDVDVNVASSYRLPFQRIEKLVLPDRKRKATEGKTADGGLRPHHQLFLRYWWRHSFDRPEMVARIAEAKRYICCSIVTKRPTFIFAHSSVRPSNLLEVFTFPDDYSFGILQSDPHWQWFIAKCSKLKSDFRYTPPSVFDTFPWPQSPTKKQIKAVAAAGREVRSVRAKVLPTMSGGLRALYRTLELPGSNPLKDAHAALDAAVMEAYGFSARKDLLKQLLDLNAAVARAIKQGQSVTAPGVPPSYGDASDLVSDDCIEP
jgi:hypothetical protein